MKRRAITLALLLSLIVGVGISCAKKKENKEPVKEEKKETVKEDKRDSSTTVKTEIAPLPAEDKDTRYTTLSDADFKKVASELGVEVAAMKAVVVIEAGPKMEGFWAPGVPVVNFDQSMFNTYKSKASSKGNPSEKVPSGLSGYALKEWTQLVNARKKTVDGANMGTFWGMFQIGGFNYKRCGCETVEEFVKLMSYSELEQLELFASFLINTGMVDDLKKKNWSNFARRYNGASYAKRGYHTKMANAYSKFKGK